jgi:hypothetical protein
VHICYVDEAGSAEELLCKASPSSTPIFTVAGLIVPHGQLKPIVWDFLQMKKRYIPSLQTLPLSEVIKTELKGSDIRADIRSGARRRHRRAMTILGDTLKLLEMHSCRVVARVIVKNVNVSIGDRTAYGSCVTWISDTFHNYLETNNRQDGLVVLDSRTKVKNTPNTDVITTQKFRKGGDPFPKLAEVPVFGHSDSHVAIQLADLLASGLLFPMACCTYCNALSWNNHAHAAYLDIKTEFGERVKKLQHRYFDQSRSTWRGGIYTTGSRGSLPPPF